MVLDQPAPSKCRAHSTLPAGRSAVGTLFGERRCGAPLVFYLSDFFLQHDHPENASCTTLPNTNHFTKLLETRPPCGATLTRTLTELIYTHHEDSHARTAAEAPYTQGLSRQNAVYLEADRGFISSEDQHQIRTILSALHATYPALDYPQYEDRLRQQGIMYLIIASMFEADFYVAEVGMVPGAAYLFCHWVEEELSRLGRRRQGSKDTEELLRSGLRE
jgi:hypothetical protein